MKSKKLKNQFFLDRVNHLMSEYNSIIIVDIYNVSSDIISDFRKQLHQDFFFEKKKNIVCSLIKKTILEHVLKINIDIKTQNLCLFINNKNNNYNLFLWLKKKKIKIKGIIIKTESGKKFKLLTSKEDLLLYIRILKSGSNIILFEVLFKNLLLLPLVLMEGKNNNLDINKAC